MGWEKDSSLVRIRTRIISAASSGRTSRSKCPADAIAVLSPSGPFGRLTWVGSCPLLCHCPRARDVRQLYHAAIQAALATLGPTDSARRPWLIDQPTNAPNRRPHTASSTAWLCATVAGMMGLGRISPGLPSHAAYINAVPRATRPAPPRSMRTAGSVIATNNRARPAWSGNIHGVEDQVHAICPQRLLIAVVPE